MSRVVEMEWRGLVSQFLQDETRLIDLEGAFRSGKTTAALWKVFNSCQAHPGIKWLVCRYSDGDTQSKLKPDWLKILAATEANPSWDAGAQCYTFANDSQVYMFGLKAPDMVSRYGKLRGLTLAGVYVDQAEELPEDIFQELVGRLSQKGQPHQLLLTPNPPDTNHWLARHFPEDNRIVGRKLYAVPIYANAHNIAEQAIRDLERVYPPSHPKHRPAILGQRGLNVIGRPVYGGDPDQPDLPAQFTRATHVRRITMNPYVPLLTGIDFGKHHPCAVFAQFTPYGQFHILGGVLGEDLFLEEDFLPVVKQFRSQWFPRARSYEECCDPAGSHDSSQGLRENGVQILRKHGFAPRWEENSNSMDVRLAMIERIAGYMHRRTGGGEGFAVNDDPEQWLLVSPRYVKSLPFVTDALEAGYVWDKLDVSVGGKKMRRPLKDGFYEHGMNCLEYLEHNFGGEQPSMDQVRKQVARQDAQALRRAQRDTQDLPVSRPGFSRAGYR